MTKARAPLTFGQAMMHIVGLMGIPAVKGVVRRSPRLIRYWTEDDKNKFPTIDQAVKLDAAYLAAGGTGAPLFETYALLLDRETAIACADAEALASATATAAKEAGEAIAALVHASRPSASPRDRLLAEAETEQAIGAFTQSMRHLAGKPTESGMVAVNGGL